MAFDFITSYCMLGARWYVKFKFSILHQGLGTIDHSQKFTLIISLARFYIKIKCQSMNTYTSSQYLMLNIFFSMC